MRNERPAAKAERVQLHVWSLIAQAYEKRRKDGISQSQLARKLGVPRGQVCLWLRDRERMTLKAAARLADAMDYDLDVRLVRRERHAVDQGAAR